MAMKECDQSDTDQLWSVKHFKEGADFVRIFPPDNLDRCAHVTGSAAKPKIKLKPCADKQPRQRFLLDDGWIKAKMNLDMCVVPKKDGENKPITLRTCDKSDKRQKWIFTAASDDDDDDDDDDDTSDTSNFEQTDRIPPCGSDTVTKGHVEGFAVMGDAIAIGSTGKDSFLKGAVCIYNRSGSGWKQSATIFPPRVGGIQNFGHALAFIDEETIAISTEDDRDDGTTGAIYVFELSDGKWKELTKLTTNINCSRYGCFRSRITASSDYVVSPPLVFSRKGQNWKEWKEENELEYKNENVRGDAVIVDNKIYAGHGSFDLELPDGDTRYNNGGIVIFERSDLSWIASKFIKPVGLGTHREDNYWGGNFAIDGNIIITTAEEGHYATVLRRTGLEWAHEASLRPDAEADFGDGSQVAVHGNTIFISTPYGIRNGGDDGKDTGGLVFVLSRSGSSWKEVDRIFPKVTKEYDAFGWGVALSEDGSTLLVKDHCTLSDCDVSSVYVFEAKV